MLVKWIVAHWPAIVAAGAVLGSYHIGSAFVDTLPMPTPASSQFYRFVFAFSNRLAANYSRARVAKTVAAQQVQAGSDGK